MEGLKIFRKISFLTACILPGVALCQTEADSVDYFNPYTGKAAEHYRKMSRRQAVYTVNMAGYAGGGGGATYWGFSANPEITVPLGSKVEITAGISVAQSYYSGAAFIPWSAVTDGRPGKRNSSTDAFLYVAAAYRVNPRLRLRAAAFTNLSDTGNPFIPQRGFSVGGDYRFSDRAWISFNYSHIEGGMPYPFGYFGSPMRMGLPNDSFPFPGFW